MPDESAKTILEVQDLAVHFPVGGFVRGRRSLRAVDGVDITLKRGECLGLVGESGCGKSTLALAILGLQPPTRGRVLLEGQEVGAGMDRMARARIAQMVFQDPYSSLNPRQTVRTTLAAPLRLHGVTRHGEIDGRIEDILRRVGLRPEHAERYPHEFSGGQRQRIGIARALILRPTIVVLDEPVSALDVSIRAQIINLLLELKETLGLSNVMISHDLGVVEHMSDRVAVMYFGRIVETGPWETIFTRPRHPYTRALMAAIPDPFGRTRGP
jgi:peptide/nickel transport system ATP-binding protein